MQVTLVLFSGAQKWQPKDYTEDMDAFWLLLLLLNNTARFLKAKLPSIKLP